MSPAKLESGVRFGPWQGLWLMLGYLAGQFLGTFLIYFAWGAAPGLEAVLHHHRPLLHPPADARVMAWGAVSYTHLTLPTICSV